MPLINSSFSLSLWMIAGLVLLVMPLMALVHMFSNMQRQDRLTWVLLVLFMPVLGSMLYFVNRKEACCRRLKRIN